MISLISFTEYGNIFVLNPTAIPLHPFNSKNGITGK